MIYVVLTVVLRAASNHSLLLTDCTDVTYVGQRMFTYLRLMSIWCDQFLIRIQVGFCADHEPSYI